MSFNFGNQSTLGTTSTPAKPAFGNFSFGSTTTSTAPAFGTTPTNTTTFGPFGGQQPAQNAFGAPQPATGFGAAPVQQASVFGAPANQQQTTGFGTFAQPQPATAVPAFGAFGATTSAPSAFSGFGTTNTQTSTGLSGFGQQRGYTGFGTMAPTTTSAFSGFNTNTSTGFGGGFGTGGFGTSFAPKPATTGFGGFNAFGQNQSQQQQPQQIVPSADDAFAQSIFKVSIFGDERDTTIARWNYLQAMWGTGKSFYSQSTQPIEINASNYLCRFKAMSYSKLPGKDNKMGLVALVFNKPQNQVKEQQQQIVNGITQTLGNKPNLTVTVDNCISLSDNKSQLLIYVVDKSQTTNETKRIVASELGSFLNQPMTKQQLAGSGVEQILPMILPDEDQLKEYLENPPKGIDPRMWKQAKLDNPDPAKFIPVPMMGFHELRWRIKCQETEIESHTQYLAKVEKDMNELKQRHSSTTAKIMEQRRKLSDLSHRILKIIVKQESTRKMGVSFLPEEETLRSKLENMQALVSAPTQFKGRLSELLSQMRMQRNQWSHGSSNEYTLDRESSEEMQAFLGMQQKAMALLIETVNADTKALKTISDGMAQLMRGNA